MPKTIINKADKKKLNTLYKKVESKLSQLGLVNMIDINLYKVYRPDSNHYIWVTDRVGDAKTSIYITKIKDNDDVKDLTIKEKVQQIVDKRQEKWDPDK